MPKIKKINLDDVMSARLLRATDLSPMVELYGHRATIDPGKPGEKLVVNMPLEGFQRLAGSVMQQMDAEAARAMAIIRNLKDCEEVRTAAYEDPAQAN